MEYIKELLGANLVFMRKEKGLTQVAISEKLGFSHSTYNGWEKGKTWPDAISLEKLASFYGVRSSRFFHDPDLDLSQNPPIKTVSFDEKLKSLDSITREHIESLIDGLVKKSQ